MSKLLIILGVILMTSCTVTEKYYLTGEMETIIFYDTIIMPPMHIHFEDHNCDNHCIYIEEWSCEHTDTIEVEIIKKRKTLTRK